MIEFSPSRRIAHDCGDFSILAQMSIVRPEINGVIA